MRNTRSNAGEETTRMKKTNKNATIFYPKRLNLSLHTRRQSLQRGECEMMYRWWGSPITNGQKGVSSAKEGGNPIKRVTG